MSKANKTTTPKPGVRRDYKVKRPFYYFETNPVSDEFLDDLAEEYIAWSVRTGEGKIEEQSFVLSDFLDELNIPSKTFYTWLERSERLRMAHNMAKRRIGNRREKNAFLKKTSESIFLHSAVVYSESWEEKQDYKLLADYKKSLDDKEREQRAENFIVQMQAFGEGKK